VTPKSARPGRSSPKYDQDQENQFFTPQKSQRGKLSSRKEDWVHPALATKMRCMSEARVKWERGGRAGFENMIKGKHVNYNKDGSIMINPEDIPHTHLMKMHKDSNKNKESDIFNNNGTKDEHPLLMPAGVDYISAKLDKKPKRIVKTNSRNISNAVNNTMDRQKILGQNSKEVEKVQQGYRRERYEKMMGKPYENTGELRLCDGKDNGPSFKFNQSKSFDRNMRDRDFHRSNITFF
jgi:hypothetical protein